MEIKTFLRIRPLQIGNKSLYGISDDRKTLSIKEGGSPPGGLNKRKSNVNLEGPPSDQEFKFDNIYNMDSTQIEVFKGSVQPLLEEAINRSQAVGIIASGDNLSGKSYSIFGVENIQQEEFSIDQEDPKDTRGIVLKSMHYIFKKAKSEGKVVTLECQMVDLYLDTMRDLSKGKTNKFNKGVGGMTFEREKEIEIDELSNGDVKLTNVQNVKISNPKEAANFIEKCLDYQKKLEVDNGQFRSFAHTFFIINLTYGKEIHSQLYFVDLGSSERKGGKKNKEAFIIQGGLQSLMKLLQQLQVKLSEEEKEIMQFKDNKLTYVLKNLYKDYTKVHVLFHLSVSEGNLESCLKTLETADRLKNHTGKSSYQQDPDDAQNPTTEGTEQLSLDQLIQHLNKENFDLRNQIETLKRSHKIKLEELQSLLGVPCDVEYLLKNKDNAPEMQGVHEQRKAMERADQLIKSNKDLEKRLDFLTSDLQELKKDKKIQQENFSQKFIVLSSQLEQLREDKEAHRMVLENQLRMNKAYSAVELKHISQSNSNMAKSNLELTQKLKRNELFKVEEDSEKINYEMDDIKQQVKQESVVRYQRLFNLQVRAQDKEKQRIQEQYESQIKTKQETLQKLVQTYQKYKVQKDQEMKTSTDELKRLYEVFIKQDQIVQGLKHGQYSGGNNQAKIPTQDLVPHPSKDKFTKLYSVVEAGQVKAYRGRLGQSRHSSPEKLLMASIQAKHQKVNSMHNTLQSDFNGTLKSTLAPPSDQIDTKLMNQNVNDLEYNQLKQLVINLQAEVKKTKLNPLNPDNVRVEKILDLQRERERYKDLYVSESIKNKEVGNMEYMGNTIEQRNLHSSATSKRPMTTISNGSSMRGGFFVTQLGGNGASRPVSRVTNSRRNIIIRQ